MGGEDCAGNAGAVTLVHIDRVDTGSEVPDSEGGVFGAGHDEGLRRVYRRVCYLLVVSW